MAPSLSPGDHFLTRRLRRPHRGRVIFFPHPLRPDFWLVKRVVGLPGESISIAGGQVHIDGVPVDDRWGVGQTQPDGHWEVPAGKVFVLSDARDITRADSRVFGPVAARPAYVAMFRYRRGKAVDV